MAKEYRREEIVLWLKVYIVLCPIFYIKGMSVGEGIGYEEEDREEEHENVIETLAKIAVGKAKIEIDKNALGILHQIKEEIIADDISDYTYSGAIRRLYDYRLGLRVVTPAPET